MGVPSTSFADKKTRSALKPSKCQECESLHQPRCDVHLRSQHIPEEPAPYPHQNNTITKTWRPFFTPPPSRKFIKAPEDGEILENFHFMLTDNEYTSLMKAPGSAQDRPLTGAGENQYLIITEDGQHEVSSAYNTICRQLPRGSSLPRNIRECLRSPETEQMLFKRIDDVNGGVILVPASSPSPLTLNNALHPREMTRQPLVSTSHTVVATTSTDVLNTTTSFPPDYISLEDLLNSCV